MDRKIIFLLFSLSFPLWGAIEENEIELQTQALLKQAQKHREEKQWLSILQIARQLADWEKKKETAECLLLAKDLILAKNAIAGAYQMADIYKKIGLSQESQYWNTVAQKMEKRKKQRWKKH